MADDQSFKLYSHDAFIFLKTIKNESVDLIITDPPYESLEKYRAIGPKTTEAATRCHFDIHNNELCIIQCYLVCFQSFLRSPV